MATKIYCRPAPAKSCAGSGPWESGRHVGQRRTASRSTNWTQTHVARAPRRVVEGILERRACVGKRCRGDLRFTAPRTSLRDRPAAGGGAPQWLIRRQNGCVEAHSAALPAPPSARATTMHHPGARRSAAHRQERAPQPPRIDPCATSTQRTPTATQPAASHPASSQPPPSKREEKPVHGGAAGGRALTLRYY